MRDKYDITKTWVEPCGYCGTDVTMTAARWEVLGPYCDGCFGYPVCSCKKAHTGECKDV